MKHTLKTLVVTIALLFSTPAFAGWIKVSEGKEGDTLYVNFKKTLGKKGKVFYWGLQDFIVTDSNSDIFSEVLYYNGDCNKYTSQLLASTSFSGNMGQGDILFEHLYERLMDPPPPNSTEEIILKEACDNPSFGYKFNTNDNLKE